MHASRLPTLVEDNEPDASPEPDGLPPTLPTPGNDADSSDEEECGRTIRDRSSCIIEVETAPGELGEEGAEEVDQAGIDRVRMWLEESYLVNDTEDGPTEESKGARDEAQKPSESTIPDPPPTEPIETPEAEPSSSKQQTASTHSTHVGDVDNTTKPTSNDITQIGSKATSKSIEQPRQASDTGGAGKQTETAESDRKKKKKKKKRRKSEYTEKDITALVKKSQKGKKWHHKLKSVRKQSAKNKIKAQHVYSMKHEW